jgi:threonine dehydratase
MLDLDPAALARGVTAVSAGNHAIAVAYAARALGTTAKVVMPQNASPYRVGRCRALGAAIELVEDVHRAFDRVREIEREEGRTFVHPFEGPLTALGTATLGLELMEQVEGLDAVVVPIGGGGLCAGVAAAVKLARPSCLVYGVEPRGADSMARSLAAGAPQAIEAVRTIADSLGAPHAAPYSFGLVRRYVDEVVLVDDDELRRAMLLLFSSAKLAVEPAGAATTAALRGPLRERLAGRRVALIVCGANIDAPTFSRYLAEATQ